MATPDAVKQIQTQMGTTMAMTKIFLDEDEDEEGFPPPPPPPAPALPPPPPFVLLLDLLPLGEGLTPPPIEGKTGIGIGVCVKEGANNDLGNG